MSGGGGESGGNGGHPDFGMGGVAPEGDSGFGQDRSFGDNVSAGFKNSALGQLTMAVAPKSALAVELATNPTLQHNIAQVQLGYNVPGYAGMVDDASRKAMVDKARHAMAVRSLTQAGLSPEMALSVMDAREALTDASPRDFASNAAAAAILDANPNATMADMAAAIGSGAFDSAGSYGGGGAWGVNPRQPGSRAIPEEEINLFGLDFYDDVLAPIGSATLGNLTTKAALDAFKNSTLGQLVGPQTAGNLATGVGVGSAVYGMGQALKNALEGAGFNVTEEGPSKKGEIPGADIGPSMDLNFQGMEGVSVDPIGNAVFDLSRAFVSNYDNPVSYNNAVINAISNLSAVSTAGGDPTANVAQREASERRAAAAKVAAQKAAEALIAQEAARNNNIVNIPVAEGPPVNVKITKAPKRPKRGKEAANYIDPGPSPAQIAAASVVADQAKFKTLPKRIQKELRSGKQPTGSDYDVDRAMALLKPPAPPPPRPGTRAFIEGGYGGGK